MLEIERLATAEMTFTVIDNVAILSLGVYNAL